LEQASAATEEYLRLLRRIEEAELDANISLKLTQLGLNLNPDLAKKHLLRIVEEAAKRRNFVRIDMEGSAYTQKTLDIFYEIFSSHREVGPVIQAYLRRSFSDIARLNQLGVRVRLCKGAYQEPAQLAFQDKDEVHKNYDLLARELLEHGNYPALATHDEERIQAAIRFAREKGIGPDRFEFQMLYGLRRKRWTQLRNEGYAVRIYVPYGTHWFPYFVRRLRERKENWMFVLRNLVES
jgi:proline dehydrogenase